MLDSNKILQISTQSNVQMEQQKIMPKDSLRKFEEAMDKQNPTRRRCKKNMLDLQPELCKFKPKPTRKL